MGSTTKDTTGKTAQAIFAESGIPAADAKAIAAHLGYAEPYGPQQEADILGFAGAAQQAGMSVTAAIASQKQPQKQAPQSTFGGVSGRYMDTIGQQQSAMQTQEREMQLQLAMLQVLDAANINQCAEERLAALVAGEEPANPFEVSVLEAAQAIAQRGQALKAMRYLPPFVKVGERGPVIDLTPPTITQGAGFCLPAGLPVAALPPAARQ